MLPSLPDAPLPADFCSPLALLPDRQDTFINAAVLLKAAQLVHVALCRAHGATCSVQEPSISIYDKESEMCVLVAHQQVCICNTLSCRLTIM